MIDNLIIYGLATWRLASLIAYEDGPFDILAKFRYLVGVRYNELSEAYGTNVLSKAILCVWCSSVWISTLFIVMHYINTYIANTAALILAVSSLSIVIEEVINYVKK